MTIVFFTGFTTFRPHYETELELIQNHLDAGDEVIQLVCMGELMACEANPFHVRTSCQECRGMCKAGVKLLTKRPAQQHFLQLTTANRREIEGLDAIPRDVKSLLPLRIENFDIGYAVASSIISAVRNHEPDLEQLGNLSSRFAMSALAVYRSMQNHLDSRKIDRVYAFNGRFAIPRAVLRACQSRNVPCFLQERGHNLEHYALFDSVLPHDLKHTESLIRAAWERGKDDPTRRGAVAAKFYEDRASGVIQSWHSFTSHQLAGMLPMGWDHTRRNIVIFNSSEDEFASIGHEWSNPIYPIQEEAVARIARSLESEASSIHLYLRCHPNLRGLDNAQMRRIRELSSPVLTVIPPESPISTYALIEAASTVLSFGSTTGMEATYRGKPSVLAGTCFYRNLGSSYNPTTHEEVVSLLRSELTPKDREGALMYGYFSNTFGIRFKHYSPSGVFNGTFKGVRVEPSVPLWSRLYSRWEKVRDQWFNLRARWSVVRRLRRIV